MNDKQKRVSIWALIGIFALALVTAGSGAFLVGYASEAMNYDSLWSGPREVGFIIAFFGLITAVWTGVVIVRRIMR